jgi:hypothetical protein
MPKETHKAYMVEYEHAPETNGVLRLVHFHGGRGVLDRYALASARPDLCDEQSLEVTAGWPVLEEVAKWHSDRGAKITEVTEQEAHNLRRQLSATPDPEPSEVKMVRVGKLAEELGIESKLAVQKLKAAGLAIKSASSNVPDAEAREMLLGGAVRSDASSQDEGKGGKAPHERGR